MNPKIISLALFGFSLFYVISSLWLKVGTHKNMGPGFVPLLIGSLLLACTTIHLFRLFREKPPKGEMNKRAAGSSKNYQAIIGILVCTTVYPLMLERLNFISDFLCRSLLSFV